MKMCPFGRAHKHVTVHKRLKIMNVNLYGCTSRDFAPATLEAVQGDHRIQEAYSLS